MRLQPDVPHHIMNDYMSVVSVNRPYPTTNNIVISDVQRIPRSCIFLIHCMNAIHYILACTMNELAKELGAQ